MIITLFEIDSHFAFFLGEAKPKQLQGGYLMALWGHNNIPVFADCKFTAAETPNVALYDNGTTLAS